MRRIWTAGSRRGAAAAAAAGATAGRSRRFFSFLPSSSSSSSEESYHSFWLLCLMFLIFPMLSTASSVVENKTATTTTATTTVNNSNRKQHLLQQQQRRNLDLFSFSNDDSSSSNIHNNGDDEEDNNNNDNDNTLILKFSLQNENYPTVQSILDWSFVEDLKFMMQDFVCQESPLTIVSVDFKDDDYDNNNNNNISENRNNNNRVENNNNNNKINTFANLRSLCPNKVFDPVQDGQLLHPAALLTDGYNETSKLQWIGWEMRYPIWVIGESYYQKEDSSASSSSSPSSASSRLTAKQIMRNAVQSTLNSGIRDGTLDIWLKSYNITSTNISISGREYEFFGDNDGVDSDDEDNPNSNEVTSSSVEPIEDDAKAVRIIGFILLGFDVLAVVGFVYLGRLGKNRRLEREFTSKLLTTQDSSTRERMDEMLLVSKQEIIDSSEPTIAQQEGRTKTNTRTTTKLQQQHKRDVERGSIEAIFSSSPLSTDRLMTNTKRKLSTILCSRNFTVDEN